MVSPRRYGRLDSVKRTRTFDHARLRHPAGPRAICDDIVLYVWNEVVVFVVLILAAEALTDGLLVDHKLDGLDPLDHLVTQLILDPKPERGAVDQAERLIIHLVCQDALGMERVLDRLRVIIRTRVQALAKRVENDPPDLGVRLDQLDEPGDRHAPPLRDG